MNRSRNIPDAVRRFLLTSVPSVPYLEALLVFHRQPDACLAAPDVARLLYLPERTATELLQALCESGVLAREAGGYRYAPEPGLARLIDELAATYAVNLIDVTNLIHDATQKNAYLFADAFKVRKDP